jgi:hypothetical protein
MRMNLVAENFIILYVPDWDKELTKIGYDLPSFEQLYGKNNLL